ncbi:MAG: transcriptional regulator [Microthrixaceae bacterium]|nr:transcriptional regulator [Microthrixaceae bacterium]
MREHEDVNIGSGANRDGTGDREEGPEGFGRAVGERLRLIRSQKGLSLQAVEADSGEEFKASVLGAYERGERAISVPRLARLAAFYRVPVDQLLPGAQEEPEEVVREADSHGAKIDLTRLEHLGGAESDMLARYLHMIQVQRQDFNGRMLTIRRDDMRAIACILGVSYEAADSRLAELGLSMG